MSSARERSRRRGQERLRSGQSGADQSRRGLDFEDALERMHEHYLGCGWADIVKVGPPIQHRRDGSLRIGGVGPPDFSGILAGGVPVRFDAKSTSNAGDGYKLDSVRLHQGRSLARCHRLGGLAFLLMRWPAADYLVPWAAIEPRYRRYWRNRQAKIRNRGAENCRIFEEDAAEWGRRLRYRCDWLRAARAEPPMLLRVEDVNLRLDF